MNAVYLYGFFLILLTERVVGRELTLLANGTDYKSVYESPRLIFTDSEFDLCQGEFSFSFKTFSKTAVLLYQDDNGENDFLAINLLNGSLQVAALFDFKKIWRTNSKKTYSDFKWHTINIKLKCPQPCLRITVDDTVVLNAPARANCTFTTNLQIGGFTSQRLSESNSISYRRILRLMFPSGRGFLNACIRNIKYGATRKEMRDISSESNETNNVYEGCILNYCHKPDPVCRNQGRCSISSKNATNVKCDCRWTGFEGPYCEKDALRITLDGTYRVKYKIKRSHYAPSESYIFRIKTLQKNAVLFYAKGPQGYEDFMLIEIRNSQMNLIVNFGGGTNYTLIVDVNVSDENWHTVRYKKVVELISFSVDAISETDKIKGEYKLVEYNDYSYFGGITKSSEPYRHKIEIEDFIWARPGTADVNFVTGLYDTYNGHNRGYIVEPPYKQPTFNRRLPSSTPKPLSDDHFSRDDSSPECIDGPCYTKGSGNVPTPSRKADEPVLSGAVKGEDESSVTWIIVVTVIFSLVLLAAIAFFVYKWNKRYSGDFQVNRKPIGPAGMVVHYQDAAAHKEKQRQMKL